MLELGLVNGHVLGRLGKMRQKASEHREWGCPHLPQSTVSVGEGFLPAASSWAWRNMLKEPSVFPPVPSPPVSAPAPTLPPPSHRSGRTLQGLRLWRAQMEQFRS